MESVSDSLVRNMPAGAHFVWLCQCFSCPPFLHKGAGTCPPAGLMPWYLLHALETVLGDTANLLVTAHIDVPSLRSWTTCSTWLGWRYHLLPIVTGTLAKHRTRKEAVRSDKEKAIVRGHHSLFGGCLDFCLCFVPVVTFTCTKPRVKLIHNHLRLINGQIEICDVLLTCGCPVMFI